MSGTLHATACMCLDDPLQHHERWSYQLLDTHPPISEWILVLQQISHGQHVEAQVKGANETGIVPLRSRVLAFESAESAQPLGP